VSVARVVGSLSFAKDGITSVGSSSIDVSHDGLVSDEAAVVVLVGVEEVELLGGDAADKESFW
jgi:hypothetical protein